MVDQHGRRRLRVAGGQAPRLLHSLGLHADHGADLPPLCGDPGVAQLADAAALAHPVGRLPALAMGIGDADVAAEADDAAEAEFGQEPALNRPGFAGGR